MIALLIVLKGMIILMEEIDSNLQNDIKDDYNFARDNLYDVIEKGNEALEDLIQVAKASEHPRAYEVVAQLIKTLNDSNQNLMDVQKNNLHHHKNHLVYFQTKTL